MFLLPSLIQFISYISWVQVVGDFLQFTMTRPILATEALHNLSLVQHMKSFDQPYEFSGCTCSAYDCMPVKKHINYHILLAQWITISLRLQRKDPTKDCIPIYIKHIEAMNKVFEKLGDRQKHCPLIGCPFLPMKGVNVPNIKSSKLKICEPVAFSATIDGNSQERSAVKARETPYI